MSDLAVLSPIPGHAGDVVGGVAPEGEDVGDLGGLDPEKILHPGLVDRDLLGRIVDRGHPVDRPGGGPCPW